MLLSDGSNDAASVAAAAPRPWGYVATFAWLLLAAVLAIAASAAVLALTSGGRLENSADLMSDGPLVSELTLVSTAVEIGVVAFAARLAGWRASEYLALVVPDARWTLI